MSSEAFIVDAVRTPLGRIGGALAGVRPDDLLAGAVRAIVDRSPSLDPASIDEVYAGDANGAGEDNRNVGRMAVLLAGLPTTIPAATVNRLCGSGIEAIFGASRTVAVGDADITIACGVESMTRAVGVLKPSKAYPTSHEQLWNSALGWRMINPKMPGEWTISLGEGAEVLADKYSISRDEQGRVRGALAPACRGCMGSWSLRRRDRAGRRRSDGARRMHPPRLVDGIAGQAEAGVPAGRFGHGRQCLADERRSRGHARDVATRPRDVAGHADGADRQPGHQRCRPPSLRHRSGRSGAHRPATGGLSAGATSLPSS